MIVNLIKKNHYYFIRDHFNNEIQLPSKKNKARHSSTYTCNIVQVRNDVIVLNSHVDITEDMESSRQDTNLDSDSDYVFSTTSVASVVSRKAVQTTFQLIFI